MTNAEIQRLRTLIDLLRTTADKRDDALYWGGPTMRYDLDLSTQQMRQASQDVTALLDWFMRCMDDGK